MIVDSSALVAIILNEPEAKPLVRALAEASAGGISTVTWLESMIVLECRRGPAASHVLQLTLADLDVRLVAFDREHMLEAYAAWQRYGKGRHPAKLNLGDCCAYAAARLSGEPLLFKGGDFALTDVDRAEW